MGRCGTKLFTPEPVCRRKREDGTLVPFAKTVAYASGQNGKVDLRDVFIAFRGEPGSGETPALTIYVDVQKQIVLANRFRRMCFPDTR